VRSVAHSALAVRQNENMPTRSKADKLSCYNVRFSGKQGQWDSGDGNNLPYCMAAERGHQKEQDKAGIAA